MRKNALNATLSAFVMLGLFSSGAAHAQVRSLPEVISSCEGCHGANRQAGSAAAPRLNGQTREYLIARLNGLRNPNNQTVSAVHNMLWPVRGIRESDIAALADHFAAQPPANPNGQARARAAGAQLYAHGAGDRLPGCASCHGAAGEGIGEAPRLAGQHGAYLVDQMEAFMLTARVQTGMNRHIWGITPEEIRALAAFLAND